MADTAAYLSMLSDLGYRIHELSEKGPGDLIEALPADIDKPGYFINIVATCEPRLTPIRA